ncbi:hypothetical protein Tco_1386624 [Tanacetum coccineum]
MPRGGVELEQFTDMINSLADLQLPNMQDRWFWSLSGSGDFSVASVRKIFDDHLLPEVSSKFSWRKMVPIKVNILAWNVKLDVLPTRFNLSKRGIKWCLALPSFQKLLFSTTLWLDPSNGASIGANANLV